LSHGREVAGLPASPNRIADPAFIVADRIADALNSRGHRLTTADRILVANEVALSL
jgi:hypothetical protein